MNVLALVLDSAAPLDVHHADVLAVAPALNSRLRHIASHAGRTSRLGHDVAERARRRFAVPVHEPEERLPRAA